MSEVTGQDVVVKRTEPLRVAELVASAVPGPAAVAPVFARLIPRVLAALDKAAVRPGISVGHYEVIQDDGSMIVHVGFEVGDQMALSSAATAGDELRVVDLPVVTAASLLHRGQLDTLPDSYAQLTQWVQTSGHTSIGQTRELYHRFDDDDPANNVTELQMVLTG